MIFYGYKHCNLMTNVESDNLLILTHQTFRGLEQNSLKMAGVNQYVLCFTEHYVVKLNLCPISLENYSMGSKFSHSIYQKDDICIFIIKDICYSSLISLYTVKKKILELYMCVCIYIYTIYIYI
jgi:hypothetical protein